MLTSEVGQEGAMIMAIWLFHRRHFHDPEGFSIPPLENPSGS
jgi:hypothetical protein